MSGKRYTEEFKIEAVKQVTERGHPATEVAARPGVSSHSLYQWGRRYSARFLEGAQPRTEHEPPRQLP